MAIERLQLMNFQCHEDLRVVLDEKVTAIVGPSDVGKSAILRAKQWIATNRPRGDRFIRKGAEEAVVSVWVEGMKLSRCKGKENKYRIGDVELKAVGFDVPQRISSILQVDEMNFQGQHEGPFWFNLTGGELAKRLNVIVDLDVIDKVQAVLSSRLRKATAKKAVVEERLEEAKEKLEGLEFVDAMDGVFSEVEKLGEDREKTAGVAKDLRGSIEDWEMYQEQLGRIENLSLLGVSAVEQGRQAKELRERQERLDELVERMREAKERAVIKVPDVEDICTQVMDVIEKRKKQKQVSELVEKWGYRMKRLQQLMIEQNGIEDELEEKLQGTCPLCGRELKSV